MEEIWKSIPGYNGIYEVSNLGNVKSLSNNKKKKEKILKPSKCNNGYFFVGLCKNCKSKSRTIHQLVAEAFLNHIPCGHVLVIDHLNNIRHDNRVENLKIVTNQINLSKERKLHRGLPYNPNFIDETTKKINEIRELIKDAKNEYEAIKIIEEYEKLL